MNFYPLKFCLSLVLCATIQFAGAQSVHITLGSMSHPDITQSLICISDFQGKVYFEQFLTPDENEYGTDFNIPVPDPEHYCLSIINEYQIDTINSGSPFVIARTFYDLSRDIHILRFEHPELQQPFNPQEKVALDLQNVNDIEFWRHASRSTISFWKQNKNAVWAQTNVWPDEDLFVVMKSATDPMYKYVYIPHDRLPDLPDRIEVSDAIDLDWKFLQTDLQRMTIKLPFQTKFSGLIYATNSKTGNKCVFLANRHTLDSFEEYGESFDLFLPTQPFGDFYAELEWYGAYAYTYRIVHGYDLNFPHFDKAHFVPESYQVDSLRIQTKMNPFPEYFRIIYRASYPNEEPKVVGQRIKHTITSQWIVIGKNPSNIDFTLPNISQASKEKFTTVGRWFVGDFENVKVLEEETEIDWINFFREYNLLRVRYRDPYK